MSWFYWFGKSNNKSNFLEDLNAKNPEVFSKEKFDKLNSRIELLTFEKNSLEALLSDSREKIRFEREQNECLRVQLSELRCKLETIVSIAESDDFGNFEIAAEEVPQEEEIKTNDIIDGINCSTSLRDNESSDIENDWFNGEELPPFPELTKSEDFLATKENTSEGDSPWDHYKQDTHKS